MAQNTSNYMPVIIVIVVVLVIGFWVLELQNESPMERFENASEELSDGIDDAAKEIDPHRTTGERVGDAIEELGDDIEDTSD